MARVVRVKPDPVTVDTLVKRKVRIPKISEEISSLARNARNILGYKGLSQVVNTELILAQTLKKLHIRAFTPKSVEEYKTGKVTELRDKPRFRHSMVQWSRCDIREYTKPIPEFVLHKALKIKEELPDAEFTVEELTVHPDPFLIVGFKKERYYIEVWNEPKFEAKVIDGSVFAKDDSEDDEE